MALPIFAPRLLDLVRFDTYVGKGVCFVSCFFTQCCFSTEEDVEMPDSVNGTLKMMPLLIGTPSVGLLFRLSLLSKTPKAAFLFFFSIGPWLDPFASWFFFLFGFGMWPSGGPCSNWFVVDLVVVSVLVLLAVFLYYLFACSLNIEYFGVSRFSVLKCR